MSDRTLLGPWVRRFLLEHLVAERNLARNTQCSYRDALTLLIPFVADRLHQSVDRLTLVDVSADLVRLFLADLEQSRQSTIATRNQRLTAIHALARFVGEHSPEHIAWCGQIRSIPFKRVSKAVIPSLDKPEMDALLNAPDRQTAQGRRDHALLLFGAALRISEALSLTLADVDLPAGVLTIRESKFYKTRLVPMGPGLTSALSSYVSQRAKEHSTKPNSALFLTRKGTPLVRYTAENIFRRLRVRAGVLRNDGGHYQPRLHDLRHSAVVHRLVSWYRQGKDVQRLLPQLATYLGHVHIAATQRYLTLTPELLREASQRFEHYAQGGQHE